MPPSTESKFKGSRHLSCLEGMVVYLGVQPGATSPTGSSFDEGSDKPCPSQGLRLIYEGCRGHNSAAHEEVQIGIEYDHGNSMVTRVGFLQLELLNMKTSSTEYLLQANESSTPIYLSPHPGSCWQSTDFSQTAIMIKSLTIESQAWVETVGHQILASLIHIEQLKDANIMLAWITEHEHDKMMIFRKAGFRRVANSSLFGMAKDPSHPSYQIPPNEDAPYYTQPIQIPRSGKGTHNQMPEFGEGLCD